MKKISKKTLRYLLMAALVLTGAVGGYLYYRLKGCAGGTCLLSSNPVISTLYGGVIGGLLGVAVTPGEKKAHKEESTHE